MKITVAKVTDAHVYFTISEPTPEVIDLPVFHRKGFEGSIAPGSIPHGVKQIDAASVTLGKLEAGAIPDSVTHLHLVTLNDKMVIPPSVKHLFLLDFKPGMIAFVPDTVTHLYIHAWDHELAPPDRVHYLFRRFSIPGWFNRNHTRDVRYCYSEEYQEHLFGSCFAVVKRTPKTVMPTSESCVLIVGKTYTDLVIPDTIMDTLLGPDGYRGPIRPGSIPRRITKLDLHNNRVTELEPGVIHDAVTHLSLRILTKDMTIPSSVKHLAIYDYAPSMIKYVPLTVTHLYIHVDDRELAPKDRVHYLFRAFYITDRNINLFEAEGLDTSLSTDAIPFEHMKGVIKREPKKPTAKGVVDPKPACPSTATCSECSCKAMTKIESLEAQIAALKATVDSLIQSKNN